MPKFILLYRGPATPMDQMTPEQRQKVGAKWGEWMGRVGSALTDMGQPMAGGEAIMDDGSSGQATELSGYSIVEAADMVAAKKLVEGHPFLSDKTGRFCIEVHELLPAPSM